MLTLVPSTITCVDIQNTSTLSMLVVQTKLEQGKAMGLTTTFLCLLEQIGTLTGLKSTRKILTFKDLVSIKPWRL